jgi:hypothetical protein
MHVHTLQISGFSRHACSVIEAGFMKAMDYELTVHAIKYYAFCGSLQPIYPQLDLPSSIKSKSRIRKRLEVYNTVCVIMINLAQLNEVTIRSSGMCSSDYSNLESLSCRVSIN